MQRNVGKTMENLYRVGWSQDLPDTNQTSSQQSGIKYTNINVSPDMATALILSKSYVKINFIPHMTPQLERPAG
jgi:hypothetical protein